GCEILLGYGASRIVRFTPDGEGTSAAFGLINTRCRTRQRNARAAGRPRRSVELSAGPITMEATPSNAHFINRDAEALLFCFLALVRASRADCVVSTRRCGFRRDAMIAQNVGSGWR